MKTPFLIAFATVALVGCEQQPTAVSPAHSPLMLASVSAADTGGGGGGGGGGGNNGATSLSIPIELLVFVPCANGGSGEVIDVSGPLHVVSQLTVSASGNFSDYFHFQPQGITGTGETTGLKYQATGITEQSFSGSLQNGQLALTFVNNFNIIGQGPGNNFLVHETLHFTINADGTLTVSFDNLTVDCK